MQQMKHYAAHALLNVTEARRERRARETEKNKSIDE